MRIRSLFCILSVVIQSILAENQLRRIPSDAFTVIFVSDMETLYRSHRVEWCQRIVDYIKNIGNEDFYFSGYYASVKMDPKLVIHGGDISDKDGGIWSWKQNFRKRGKSATEFLMDNIWGQLYDAGIPMISALGNHDYDEKRKWRLSNTEANKFVLQTYEKSKALMGDDFSYVEYKTAKLPSQFVSDLWGFQFVNFNLKPRFQQNGLKEGIDPDKKTIFFSHFNLMEYDYEATDPNKIWVEASYKDNDALSTMKSFATNSDANHFSGHLHHVATNDQIQHLSDNVAAYPHPWDTVTSDCPNQWVPSGFYALLVSPTDGLLQTDRIHFTHDKYRSITKCWKDGVRCNALSKSCKMCCTTRGSRWNDRRRRCGYEKCQI
jgi:hypothetical protein